MKKLISLFLTVILALSLMPSAFAAEGASVDKFTDVPADAWYREELAYAVYNGYISGTSATSFSPDGLVTRGQFVTILGRMLKVDTSAYTSSKFTDVDASSWYGPYVAWAASEGYVNGTSSTTFAPGNNITVEQMGTILANYIRKSGVALTGTTPQEQYADANTISGWAKDNMELMRQNDLLPVDGKGNVSPRKAATRAEATVSLVRLAQSAGWGTAPAERVPTSGYAAEAEAKAKEVHDEMWASGKITASMTEKDRAITYYLWMCQNCIYRDSSDYPFRHTAYGSLIEGFAVCDGLSRGYMLLLQTEGIECGLLNSDTHMWNSAVLDGIKYEIDVTGGVCSAWNTDGSYNDEGARRMCDKSFMDYDEWVDKWYGHHKPLEW